MGISSLPKPGSNFRAKNHFSSFEYKLKRATRQGDLKNLANNIPAIVKTVKKYEKYIKRGGLSLSLKYSILKKIRKIDKNLSKDDLREIKEILNYLGKK